MQQEIYKAILAALQELGVTDAPFVVERPSDFSHGDYSTNAALIASKQLGKNPKEVAELILKKLSIEGVEKIETAGPGFINFFLSRVAIMEEVEKMAKNEFPKLPSEFDGQTVMVEYTDPNPFKEFHIGHLMSNTIGESIARVLEYSGAKVIRANYQGDVGPHVAKAVWTMLFSQNKGKTIEEVTNVQSSTLGYIAGNKKYEEDADAKKEIDEINKKIYEKSDSQINVLYTEGRTKSLKHFEALYEILGTKFDQYFFESETWQKGLALVESHIQDGVFEKSDGAIVFKGEKVGLHTRVFVNSAGLPTYEAKDLGLLQLKQERTKQEDIHLGFSITVTASEQTEYFKVVLAAAKEIVEVKDIADKTMHVSHGMMRFADGKMSSRKGNVITGESLLMDLKDAAKAKMEGRELKDAEKTAEQVAVGAIKYAVLKQGSGKDIIFDPEKSLSLQGDSGSYLQYARVRASSLIGSVKLVLKMKVDNNIPDKRFTESDSLAQDVRFLLERTLIHFSEVVERAARELEPHYVTTYLTELASAFNSWYMSERVIGSNRIEEGLLLAEAVEHALDKGLNLLGIPAPEEM